jgi:hypothetical protein
MRKIFLWQFENVTYTNSFSSQLIQNYIYEVSNLLFIKICVMFIFLSENALQQFHLSVQPSQDVAHELLRNFDPVHHDAMDVEPLQDLLPAQPSQNVALELLESDNPLPLSQNASTIMPNDGFAEYVEADYTNPFVEYHVDDYHTVGDIYHPLLVNNHNDQNSPVPSQTPQAIRKWGSTGHHTDESKKKIRDKRLAVQKDRDPAEVS